MKLSQKIRMVFHCTTSVFLVISMMVLMVSCKNKEEKPAEQVARPVKMMTIEAGGSIAMRKFPGTVRAVQRVDLAFQVSGPLIELPVDEGQQVKKRQMLARILPRDFETNLAKTKAKSLEAEQQYNRYRELYIRKQVSKADFDKYKAQYDIAKAREKEAQDALNDTYLRAPFSGVIAKRYVDNFKEIQAKEPIVSLQDISFIEILVDLPEAAVVTAKDIKDGSSKNQVIAYAEFASAPEKKYPLTLKEYKTEADPQTLTYQFTLKMKQPEDLTVLPGMTANVIGRKDKDKTEKRIAPGPVLVPASAVYADESGEPHVWVVNRQDMTVTKRKVTTGDLTGTNNIQITSGLEAGETIALTGITQLQENMKVRDLSELEGYGK